MMESLLFSRVSNRNEVFPSVHKDRLSSQAQLGAVESSVGWDTLLSMCPPLPDSSLKGIHPPASMKTSHCC